MFPQEKRLTRGEFPTVLKSGRKISSSHFTIVLPKDARGLPAGKQGYAVVVSKKVARLSVTRHRIKRRVLEALRELPLPPSLILFPTSAVVSMTYKDIQSELTTLLSKVSR